MKNTLIQKAACKMLMKLTPEEPREALDRWGQQIFSAQKRPSLNRLWYNTELKPSIATSSVRCVTLPTVVTEVVWRSANVCDAILATKSHVATLAIKFRSTMDRFGMFFRRHFFFALWRKSCCRSLLLTMLLLVLLDLTNVMWKVGWWWLRLPLAFFYVKICLGCLREQYFWF